MYDWCTHTHSHLGGECSHKCIYCYVQAIERRYKTGRYAGAVRLIEKELDVRYGSGKTIFIEHMNDLWAEEIPYTYVASVLDHCERYPKNNYVFQTKNPVRYLNWFAFLPPRRMLGCTIESTDAKIVAQVSEAPDPLSRVQKMAALKARGERLFVTVEPILRGNMYELAAVIAAISPEFVNIGADSKGSGLPEPSANEVRLLIEELRKLGVNIRQKSNLERLLQDRHPASG
jgi:DNA repair photolyase